MNAKDRKRYAWGFRWFLPSAGYPRGTVQFNNGREYFNVTPSSLGRLMYIAQVAGISFDPYSVRFTKDPPSPRQQWYLSASIIRRQSNAWKDRY